MPDHSTFEIPDDGSYSTLVHFVFEIEALDKIINDQTLKGLMREIRDRMPQLDYLFKNTIKFERFSIENTNLMAASYREHKDKEAEIFTWNSFAGGSKAELYAEAYYMFAFRVFDITRDINKRLFGTDSICPQPKGIRDVRNHLIIHPENRPLPIISRSFKMVAAEGVGVILKPNRLDGEASDFFDLGVHANSCEFSGFMRNWLTLVKSRLQAT
jgi:hypothetical protein